jgi:hypothetical protein
LFSLGFLVWCLMPAVWNPKYKWGNRIEEWCEFW